MEAARDGSGCFLSRRYLISVLPTSCRQNETMLDRKTCRRDAGSTLERHHEAPLNRYSRRTGAGQSEGRFDRNSPRVRHLFLQKPLARALAHTGRHRLFFACLLLSLSARMFAGSTPIRFAGQNAELVLSEISARTLRIELFALDEQGRSRPPAPSTVLVPFPSTDKLRARQMTGAKELRSGRLRVTVKTQPLTVTVRRQDGKLVQELTFDDTAATNAGVAFHTDAPVLGLGEGAQQFDRRGALYLMEPSWGGWNRPVLGSVVPSPILIGTDGWALFAHRPEGQFDLRAGKGRFIPQQDPQGIATHLRSAWTAGGPTTVTSCLWKRV